MVSNPIDAVPLGQEAKVSVTGDWKILGARAEMT